MTRRASVYLAFLLVVLASLVAIAVAASGKHRGSSDDHLIVHEWGTFTSIVDETGAVQIWRPLGGPTDLPDFVYGIPDVHRHSNPEMMLREKDNLFATVRMETPVIYFYADQEMDASVKVDFPKGKVTDWYPQSRSADSWISWDAIRVRPGSTPEFPVRKNASRYYEARNTDASPLSVSTIDGQQNEKFLFYRGIGTFNLPLSVRPDQSGSLLKISAQQDVHKAILFENADGKSTYQVQDLNSGQAVFDRRVGGQDISTLRGELVKTLIESGLYEREATAMVATWGDSWFEPGLRVFYVLPRRTTDLILPMTIEPKPDELVRVLVCRTEIMTPETEARVQRQLETLPDDPGEIRAAIDGMAQQYGRFLEAILARTVARMDDNQLRIRISARLAELRRPAGAVPD